MCSLTTECVLYYRMCSLTHGAHLSQKTRGSTSRDNVFNYYRMCPLTIECVLLLQNVFSYYRMCSLTIECVLLLQNVFSYYLDAYCNMDTDTPPAYVYCIFRLHEASTQAMWTHRMCTPPIPLSADIVHAPYTKPQRRQSGQSSPMSICDTLVQVKTLRGQLFQRS